MSNAALSWAFPIPVTGPRKAVLTALAEHADEVGGCWPSIARLVLYSGVSERTVQTAIRDLERAALVRVDHSSGRTSNRYWLSLNTAPDTGLISLIEAPKERKTKRINGANGAAGAVLPDKTTPHGAHVNGAPAAPLPRSGHINGAAGAPDPARGAPEPLKNPQQNPQLILIEPSPSASARFDELFLEGVHVWNLICGVKCPKANPAASLKSAKRRRAFLKFVHGQLAGQIDQWKAYCEEVAKSNFLTGGGKQRWRATFDWSIDPDNYLHVMEGKYAQAKSINAELTGFGLMDAIRNGPSNSVGDPDPPTIDPFGNPILGGGE